MVVKSLKQKMPFMNCLPDNEFSWNNEMVNKHTHASQQSHDLNSGAQSHHCPGESKLNKGIDTLLTLESQSKEKEAADHNVLANLCIAARMRGVTSMSTPSDTDTAARTSLAAMLGTGCAVVMN